MQKCKYFHIFSNDLFIIEIIITFPPGFNASLGAIFQDLLPLKGVDPNDPVLMMIVAQPKVLNALESMEGPGIESSFKGQSNFRFFCMKLHVDYGSKLSTHDFREKMILLN